MGTFLFKWDHPAQDVHVTGTFDNWSKSVQLEKNGDGFEKLVTLPTADEKIYYKFVVDGTWTTDHTAPQETDSLNNVNNVLTPEHIKKSGIAAAGAAVIGGVTAAATTVGLAGQVPKESTSTSKALPGHFPETPADEARQFDVKPLPASSGAANPITLGPGEPVPESIKTAATTEADSLDKESYEKAGSSLAFPSSTTAPSGGLLGVLPIGRGVIPESSIPMGTAGGPAEDLKATPTIQSAGANTSTSALAAGVPKEPRGVAEVVKSIDSDHATAVTSSLPETVKASVAEAKTSLEAAAIPAVVKEKAAVETELLKEVKTSNATGAPAPVTTAATSSTAPAATEPKTQASALKSAQADSRDISPMTRSDDKVTPENKPVAATPVAASTSAPAENTLTSPDSPSKTPSTSTEQKKRHRASGFFGKLKDRLKH